MLKSIVLLLESISIFFLVTIVGLIFFVLYKYFKNMEKPPFWTYMCGGFILSILHELMYMRYYTQYEKEIPLLIIKVMSYFAVLIGVIQLHIILKRTLKKK